MIGPVRVLLTDSSIAAHRKDLTARLEADFELLVPATFSEDALIEAAREVEVIVGGRVRSSVLRAAHWLRLLQLWIAGADHLDFSLLQERNVLVAAAHENARAVAELALTLIVSGARGVALGDRRLRYGDWTVGWAKSRIPRRETYGKTVGVIGFGAVGRAFADLARGFDFRMLAIKRRPDPELRERYRLAFMGTLADVDRVLAESDFVLVALPKTPETVGLLDASRLRTMRPTAWLIQIGRSAVVDEEALYRACREQWIGGAGIDVWYQYPPPEPCLPSRFPFHELDNVIMTPHCGGWTLEAIESQVSFVAENLRRFRAGQPLEALVDLELGY